MNKSLNREITAKALVLLLSVVIISLHYFYLRPWMLDDAFISFRYAENFAHGSGLVYNPGDNVEGYTSFLWVIILGMGKFLGADPVNLSKILGFLFSAGTPALLLFFPRKGRNLAFQSIIAVLMLSTCGSFTAWATSGMETSMFIFLVTLAFLLYEDILQAPKDNKFIYLGLLAGVLTLTRPEGAIFFLCMLLLINVFKLTTVRRFAVRESVRLMVPFLLITGSHLAFRLWYYHDFLPNTFFDKVGRGFLQIKRGLAYFRTFIRSAALILAPNIFLIAMLLKKDEDRKYFFYYSLLFSVSVYSLYVIYVGGDVMPAYRFFVPVLPLLALLAAFCLQEIGSLIKTRLHLQMRFADTLPVIILVAFICVYNLAETQLDTRINHDLKGDSVAYLGKEAGLWLKDNFDAKTVIATNTAGSIPYYSGLTTIDMLGLNDRTIARRSMPNMGGGMPGHEKADGKYVFSRNPDIIQFGSSLGSASPMFESDLELIELPDFSAKYKLESFVMPSGDSILLYIRKDYQGAPVPA